VNWYKAGGCLQLDLAWSRALSRALSHASADLWVIQVSPSSSVIVGNKGKKKKEKEKRRRKEKGRKKERQKKKRK